MIDTTEVFEEPEFNKSQKEKVYISVENYIASIKNSSLEQLKV
jgi:hypothetical protein